MVDLRRGATTHDERKALLGCFRGDIEHVLKNFVRKKRKERGLGGHR